MTDPFAVKFSGLTNFKLPSLSVAIKIIPADSIPRNFRGAKLTKTQTCLPIISSGL